jgi:glycosyltransferase involved in cell wall biosynthesis
MLPNIIAISYAKRALAPDTRERKRMQSYASVLGEYHVIVCTRASEKFPKLQQDGNLFLHATNAHTKLGMVVKAYLIGRKIIKNAKKAQWVVSAQDPFATSLIALPLSFSKKVALHVQLHGDSFNPHSYTSISGLTGIARVLFGTWVVRKAKKVRVVSERIKKSLIGLGVPESRIAVLPIQADLEEFLAVGKQRTYAPEGSVTLLYVGRFSPEKNVPLLLNAFAQIVALYPYVQLQLLGDGAEKKHLEKQIESLGIQNHVTFLAWTNDVAEVMAKADILCLASLHEGYAMVLVEAMAAGVPVVTTDVGCAREVLKHNEHGLVVPVAHEEAYTKALVELVQHPLLRERFGRVGHDTITQLKRSDEEYLHAIVESFTI